MSQLVPCPSCGRHVRLPSASCPFCDVVIDTAVLGERFAPRRSNVQSGVKRAVMFAVGASMAAACGGETDPNVGPVYGAPIAPSSSASSETSVDDMTEDSTTEDNTSEPMAQPEYGAPVPADSSVQAIYGAPISPSSTEQPTLGQPEYGAPVPPEEPIDAGAEDAGAADAAVDASVPEPIDPDPGPSVQPLYGAPALN